MALNTINQPTLKSKTVLWQFFIFVTLFYVALYYYFYFPGVDTNLIVALAKERKGVKHRRKFPGFPSVSIYVTYKANFHRFLPLCTFYSAVQQIVSTLFRFKLNLH